MENRRIQFGGFFVKLIEKLLCIAIFALSSMAVAEEPALLEFNSKAQPAHIPDPSQVKAESLNSLFKKIVRELPELPENIFKGSSLTTTANAAEGHTYFAEMEFRAHVLNFPTQDPNFLGTQNVIIPVTLAYRVNPQSPQNLELSKLIVSAAAIYEINQTKDHLRTPGNDTFFEEVGGGIERQSGQGGVQRGLFQLYSYRIARVYDLNDRDGSRRILVGATGGGGMEWALPGAKGFKSFLYIDQDLQLGFVWNQVHALRVTAGLSYGATNVRGKSIGVVKHKESIRYDYYAGKHVKLFMELLHRGSLSRYEGRFVQDFGNSVDEYSAQSGLVLEY